MIVFLNGEFVPEAKAVVSVFDRGLLYGDGLFETIRVANGKPFRWDQHDQRLRQGAEFLGIRISRSSGELREAALSLVQQNKLPDALLRVLVSRGVGPRGYSPRGADSPTLAMSLHAAAGPPADAPGWRLLTSRVRLPANELLARFKTCNKLAQIVARAEADAAGANEALLLNTDGWVVEGASSNLFWINAGRIHTPPLGAGILPGVTRAVIKELCDSTKLEFQESETTAQQLKSCEGLFLSLSSAGVAEGITLDGMQLERSPMVRRLHSAYWELLESECG